jgi:hypothetical protein
VSGPLRRKQILAAERSLKKEKLQIKTGGPSGGFIFNFAFSMFNLAAGAPLGKFWTDLRMVPNSCARAPDLA